MSARPHHTVRGSSALVLELLSEGPKTTGELAAAVGSSRNAVQCRVYALRAAGHDVVSEAPPDGGERVYRLRIGGRICAWAGCGERLNRYNRGPYCLAHRRAAAARALVCLDEALDELEALQVQA